ncbi:MAG: cyanophycin synthetase, partial [Sediminibacterium sp.]|nr:cyanophycin synthetase [Sediminibacterium sp.]
AVPEHTIENGVTTVTIQGVSGKLSVFGNHNLMNLQAAYYACAELGVTAADFIRVMKHFTGASKRLELLASNGDVHVYRDFAHAPSKVKATVEAVRQQYPGKKLFAVLELHTFSSLNAAFMEQYRGVFDQVDTGVVFYSRHALELKRMPDLPAEKVKEGFGKEGLLVINDKAGLDHWLHSQNFSHSNILLMSSGNYDGIDILSFAKEITQ